MTQEQLAQTPAIALAIWADIPDAKRRCGSDHRSFWLQAIISLKVYEETDPGERNL